MPPARFMQMPATLTALNGTPPNKKKPAHVSDAACRQHKCGPGAETLMTYQLYFLLHVLERLWHSVQARLVTWSGECDEESSMRNHEIEESCSTIL